MVKDILSRVQKMNIHEILDAVKYRFRIVLYIKNRKAYVEYKKSVKYDHLKKMFKQTIEKGVDETKKRVKNNTIWICWLQGIEYAPSLVQSCVRSIKKAAENSNYQVIFLSEDTISDFIELPSYIIEKRKKGIIGPAHFTDIVRTELLCKYGGGWIDSTVLCTSNIIPEYITESKLFFFQDINWGNVDYPSSILSNWLIFSESNNPILLLTRELLYKYWEKYDYVVHYFFYHMFFTMAAERYKNEWSLVPVYSNEPPRILSRESNSIFNEIRWKQIIGMTDIHKLNWKKVKDDGLTMIQYIMMHY